MYQHYQIPFNISHEPVLFLDNSLVMHSVKISFLLQPDKGLFCLSVRDIIYMALTITLSAGDFCHVTVDKGPVSPTSWIEIKSEYLIVFSINP